MTTMSDRLEKYRKFAVTGVIGVTHTANPSKSAEFLEGAEVTPTAVTGVIGVIPSKSATFLEGAEVGITQVTEITVGDLKSVTPIRASNTAENRRSWRRVTPITPINSKK
jgi:hypothetical protein